MNRRDIIEGLLARIGWGARPEAELDEMIETIEVLLVEAVAITGPNALDESLDEIRSEQTGLEDEVDAGA
jgi:DNA-binding IclR family transcriptional regulator